MNENQIFIQQNQHLTDAVVPFKNYLECIVILLWSVGPSRLNVSEFRLVATVSQLDKCLKFRSVRGGGDKNDCILYQITPQSEMNLGIYQVLTL